MIKKITNNLNGFNYNVIIANIYEMYNFLSKEIEKKIDSEILKDCYKKILILLSPPIPHFAAECMEDLNLDKDLKWPKINTKLLEDQKIDYVVQINGKKRGLVQTKPNINEEKLFEIMKNDEKIMKYFDQKKIKKKIYIRDKLLNIII